MLEVIGRCIVHRPFCLPGVVFANTSDHTDFCLTTNPLDRATAQVYLPQRATPPQRGATIWKGR